MTEKAKSDDFFGRFREVISDPINLLIPRHPNAGVVQDGIVTLHNGHRVPADGDGAYYGTFSDILVLNRGVHEPLEEYVFSLLLRRMPPTPRMLELGAYWGHYSMWLCQAREAARVHLVEPSDVNIEAGKTNFQRNGHTGTFEQAFVSQDAFTVDEFMRRDGWDRLDILHSDIQGYEAEMITGAEAALTRRAIDYVCVSTHSQTLHEQVVSQLEDFGYRIEVSADFDHETTCYDGFLLAASPSLPPVWTGPKPLSRDAICAASPGEILDAARLAFDNLKEDSESVSS